jgi:hypothetical protein
MNARFELPSSSKRLPSSLDHAERFAAERIVDVRMALASK